jgi:hypothetical protein
LRGLQRGASLGERATDVNVLSLGVSQSGEAIEAIAFTRPPATPAIARRPTVVLLAGSTATSLPAARR